MTYYEYDVEVFGEGFGDNFILGRIASRGQENWSVIHIRKDAETKDSHTVVVYRREISGFVRGMLSALPK